MADLRTGILERGWQGLVEGQSGPVFVEEEQNWPDSFKYRLSHKFRVRPSLGGAHLPALSVLSFSTQNIPERVLRNLFTTKNTFIHTYALLSISQV